VSVTHRYRYLPLLIAIAVIFSAFGAAGTGCLTGGMNAHVPALVAECSARSRIVAFSTACVYPFVPTAGEGAPESTPPRYTSGSFTAARTREASSRKYVERYSNGLIKRCPASARP